jgi:DNA polymerase-3 subunit epsilon
MFAIVDIETTGGFISGNHITEIAIVLHDGNQIQNSFTTLLNPGVPIPPFITSLTGISNAMVASAPTFEEMAGVIHHWLHDKIFVAHNVSFDFPFVLDGLRKNGLDLKDDRLCTVQLSRQVFPGLPSYSLGKLCRSLNIKVQDRHRALGDCQATAILFDQILKSGGRPLISKKLRKPSLFSTID